MDIKECFTSRWEGGLLVEADFSQLEVYGLAFLSMDKRLIADLNSGLDMHRVRAAELYGVPESSVTSEQRRTAKMLSFQLQYGAGVTTLAEKNGVPIHIARKFIDNYYRRYPEVKRWQDSNIALAAAKRVVSKKGQGKMPLGQATLIAPTGRRLTFQEYPNDRGGVGFSPTQIKNYPVQSFATGDVVIACLGYLFREATQSEYREHIKLVNTVHDSVIVDCKEEYLDKALDMIQNTIGRAKEIMNYHFNLNMEFELPIEIKVGKTWASLKKL